MHNNCISFFVLAYVLDTQRPDLHDTDPTWTMYLETEEGHKVAPTKIKKYFYLLHLYNSLFLNRKLVYVISFYFQRFLIFL